MHFVFLLIFKVRCLFLEPASNVSDECDNSKTSPTNGVGTTVAKAFDRIEVQKYKHQATSPNIPTSPASSEESSSNSNEVSRKNKYYVDRTLSGGLSFG